MRGMHREYAWKPAVSADSCRMPVCMYADARNISIYCYLAHTGMPPSSSLYHTGERMEGKKRWIKENTGKDTGDGIYRNVNERSDKRKRIKQRMEGKKNKKHNIKTGIHAKCIPVFLIQDKAVHKEAI